LGENKRTIQGTETRLAKISVFSFGLAPYGSLKKGPNIEINK
jgi:hypothetical protein